MLPLSHTMVRGQRVAIPAGGAPHASSSFRKIAPQPRTPRIPHMLGKRWESRPRRVCVLLATKGLGDPAIKTLIHGTKMGLLGLRVTQREGYQQETVAFQTSKSLPQNDRYCSVTVEDERRLGVPFGRKVWANTEPILLMGQHGRPPDLARSLLWPLTRQVGSWGTSIDQIES